MVLAAAPRHFFHYHATLLAIHPPHAIEEKHQIPPDGYEFESPLVEPIIAGAGLVTTRARGGGAAPRTYSYIDGLFVVGEFGRLLDEPWEAMALV